MSAKTKNGPACPAKLSLISNKVMPPAIFFVVALVSFFLYTQPITASAKIELGAMGVIAALFGAYLVAR